MTMTITKRVLWTEPQTAWGKAAAISYYSYLLVFLIVCILVIVAPNSQSFDCYFPTNISSTSVVGSSDNTTTTNAADALSLLRSWLYGIMFTNYAGLAVLSWIVGPTVYAMTTLFLCVAVDVVWDWVCYLNLHVDDPQVYACFEDSLYFADPIFLTWPLFSIVCARMDHRSLSVPVNVDNQSLVDSTTLPIQVPAGSTTLLPFA
ncbi:hypothetical protein ACA910_004029 [Epithemia clementina (nom. ined.)]